MYARYTEVLRDLMQNEVTRKALDAALSTYPLYQGKKTYDLIPTREELNRKLLNHYKYREIGFETVGRFLDELQIVMEEIMPEYNKRYYTIEVMEEIPNPFDNVDIVETYEEERSDVSSGTGSGKAITTNTGKDTTQSTSQGQSQSTSSGENSQKVNGKSIESDTPQDSLSIGSKDIDSVSYASMAKWDESESNGSSSNNGSETSESSSEGEANHESSGTSTTENSTASQSSGTTSHTITRKGQQGVTTFAQDIDDYRKKAIIDVTYEVITDSRINELFMMIF